MYIKNGARSREDVTWQIMDTVRIKVVNPKNPIARMFLKYNH